MSFWSCTLVVFFKSSVLKTATATRPSTSKAKVNQQPTEPEIGGHSSFRMTEESSESPVASWQEDIK